MSYAITFPCPACGTKYNVGPAHAGKKTTCKKCGAPMTVPMPDMANPTVVGTTRTIKRADIEAIISSGTGSQSGRGRKTTRQVLPGSAPEVDMRGGESVLRRTTNAPTSRSNRMGARRPTAPHHAGHAVSYQAGLGPGMPKKSAVPLIVGISSGTAVLIVLVVLAVVFAGQTETPPPAAANNAPAIDPVAQARETELRVLNNALINADTVPTSLELENFYKAAKEKADDPEFRRVQEGFAMVMLRKAQGESSERKARVGLLLDKDNVPGAKELLNAAIGPLGLQPVHEVFSREENKYKTIENPLFVEVVRRLGWQAYSRPPKFEEYASYALPGTVEFNQYLMDPRNDASKYVDVGLLPPDTLAEIKRLESVIQASIEEFEKEIKDNGEFARQARMAFVRFRTSNDTKAKSERAKGKRSFTPTAMDREGEPFDSIWTYTYWEPFMVFVEKPKGSQGFSDEFKESLASKASLLRYLFEFFRPNFIEKFGLKRVKPKEQADLAEKEGWPLEIVVLKDEDAFRKYMKDAGMSPPPGVRAFYSPLDERVMTYDDTKDQSADTVWFNESVLIHETFHMLSDHYCQNARFTKDELGEKPWFSSILVQEGLTDCVAGFKRTGSQGRDARYELMKPNHLRLRDLQGFHRRFTEGKHLFRIRDMVECRSYGQCMAKAVDRWRELGIPFQPRGAGSINWVPQAGLGLYYAASCQAAYFFQYFEEGGKFPYRDKWWEFLGKDYRGEIKLPNFLSDVGVEAFKQVFGMHSDADWDTMQKQYETFTDNLKPEDVGKSGGPSLDEPTEENGDDPAPGSRKPWLGALRFAMPAPADEWSRWAA